MLLNITKYHVPNEIKKYSLVKTKFLQEIEQEILTGLYVLVAVSSVTFRRCKYYNTTENSYGSRALLPLDNATYQCITSTVRSSIPKVWTIPGILLIGWGLTSPLVPRFWRKSKPVTTVRVVWSLSCLIRPSQLSLKQHNTQCKTK